MPKAVFFDAGEITASNDMDSGVFSGDASDAGVMLSEDGGWSSADKLDGYRYSYNVPFDIVTDGNGDLWVLGECYYSVTITGNSYSGPYQHKVCVAQRSSSGWIGVARSSSEYSPRVDAIAGHPNGGAVLWVRGDYWNLPGGGTQSLSQYDAGGLVRLHGSNRTMWLWDYPSCQGGNSCNNVESIFGTGEKQRLEISNKHF